MEEKPKEFALEYAGFWVRLGASIIDLLILYIICGTIMGFIWITACVSGALGGDYGVGAVSLLSGDFTLLYGLIPVPIILTMAWVIEAAYFVGFWVWQGQTPGKMVMGIKVIRTDSSPIAWRYGLLRYLGYIVSVMTLFIGFVWIAFDSRKQGLHDKIADTYVVKLPVRQVVFTESYARGGVSYV